MPVKCDCRSAVVGSTKETLLTAAANRLLLLGPWHVPLTAHGWVPSPTVKKNRRSTSCGTCAGYSSDARLRSLAVKLDTKLVSLIFGKVGLNRGRFLLKEPAEGGEMGSSYSRMPATVVLSKVPDAAVE